jgi:hypothetical protein
LEISDQVLKEIWVMEVTLNGHDLVQMQRWHKNSRIEKDIVAELAKL